MLSALCQNSENYYVSVCNRLLSFNHVIYLKYLEAVPDLGSASLLGGCTHLLLGLLRAFLHKLRFAFY